MKEKLSIFKIGGNVIDDENSLRNFLKQFARVKENKILVHGGGKRASSLSRDLGITPVMIDGRRITDAPTLDIAVMVYAGLINKQIVAALQAAGTNAIGLSGADANCIPAKRRSPGEIDFGFVGDVAPETIPAKNMIALLHNGLVPVCCAITHDNHGQLLNTNADTIASSLAIALASHYKVTLNFLFEKEGVLKDVNDESSVIRKISPSKYRRLKTAGIVSDGMLPKLDNAFNAIEKGVHAVRILHARHIKHLRKGKKTGTTLKP